MNAPSLLARHVWELSRAALADRGGYISVLKAYLDESGVHNGSPVVTIAGYIGTPIAWKRWTRRWVKELQNAGITVYHAVDAQNRVNEFKNWTEDDVCELVKRLLPIIAGGEIGGIAIGMDLRSFEAATKDRDDLELFRLRLKHNRRF